ncbi:DUF4062 domain-containing protein [Sphingomonas sp. CFBP 13733]|uniref:DUF4062 domain-containing protein n=1 Tax=Sphingomonas sp. CFBP 13733 TaxID=2775291 RepID=UPI001785FC44|nr:DUF4062 domain-containing protein [Sphingomonas sp. CFBP 13733]MBD8641117.1 DUF4062 domain-containing protein [Sphingomonas sp. CFBP 13733]
MSKRKLQVFVSSTFTDLVLERQAAVSAILKAGHIPAGMELFTAGDRSQMEIIERWIDESDVYMLVLGGRYGSVEPKSGMGYTELEYDYAASQGKALFAVVITEDALEEKVKAGGTDFMEKVNPSNLENFRKKVLSNISSFFRDEKDIKLAVYESLSDYSNNRDLKGWISADAVANADLLQQEVNSLREKNAALTSRIAILEAESVKIALVGKDTSSKASEELDEIEALLKNTEVELPESLNENGRRKSSNLLNIFYSTKDFFLNGITNHVGMDDGSQFLFFNVAPKLKLHGLIDNEKVVGKTYRRAVVSEKGIALLAVLERRKLAAATKAKSSEEPKPKTKARSKPTPTPTPTQS